MTKEWEVACKNCGKKFGYSDYSYVIGSNIGHSRPERCPECRKIHNRQTGAMGLAYYDLKPLKGSDTTNIRAGGLGALTHPSREHKSYPVESKFNPDKFGVSITDINKLFDWLSDPNHQVAVVEGPTGSGKSTALPYYLISPPEGYPEDFFTRNGQVVITQPRIQATRNIPAFVAKDLFGSSIGSGFDIGFRYSDHPYSDWRNRLVYLTDGTLINWIVSGQLSKLSVIMIDEAHERSLNIDLILGLLKKLLPRYPHLKLIIASATIKADLFKNYFGTEQTEIVKFQGKQKHFVKEYYAEECEKLAYEDIPKLKKIISSALAKKVLTLLEAMSSGEKQEGDILGFLHGAKEIDDAVSEIKKGIKSDSKLAELVDVYPLYTTLPQPEQDKALKSKPDPDRRRVVITTNVAETSLTVEGIVYVVDSGLIKEAQWDSESETKQVITVLHSKAGCIQRWGRAGRITDGEAYCLYTKNQFKELFLEYTIPQIKRSPLEQIVLTAKAAGIDDITKFEWIQKPPKKELERAPEILKDMGALDKEGDLTEHGLELQMFAEEPRLANLMTFADRFSCSVEMATIISMIKAGGLRHILNWNNDWDADTKQKVSNIHKALMAGCQDDIELCLKIYAAWEEMVYDGFPLDPKWAFRKIWPSRVPNLTSDMKETLGKENAKKFLIEIINTYNKINIQELLEKYGLEEEGIEWINDVDKAILDCQREAWGKAFFINHSLLKNKVFPERETLLDSLSGHKKEDERRPIDFDLIDRVRLIIAYCLKDQIYKKSTEIGDNDDGFVYKRLFKKQKNETEESNTETLVCINNDSVLAEGNGELFACLKQQLFTRRPRPDQPPVPILHLAVISFVKEDWAEWLSTNPDSYMALGKYIAEQTRDSSSGDLKSGNNYERLFLDLIYPLGTKFEFRPVGEFDDKYIELEPSRWTSEAPELIEDFRKEPEVEEDTDFDDDVDIENGNLADTVLTSEDLKALVENPDEEIVPAWVDLADDTYEITDIDENRANNEAYQDLKLGSEKENARDLEGYLNVGNWPEGPTWKALAGVELGENVFTGIVADFDFSNLEQPAIIVKKAPENDPFKYFEENFQVGEVIEVVVNGHYEKAGDYFRALIVEEPNSGLEILVEPTKITFPGRFSAIESIQPGLVMDMILENIDYDKRKPKLTILPLLEEHLREIRSNKKIQEKVHVLGSVIEINFARERVYFSIDEWCDLDNGLMHIIIIGRGGLYKQAESFSIGEKVTLEIDFSERESRVSSSIVPDEVIKDIETESGYEQLFLDDEYLKIKGAMAFSFRNELVSKNDNPYLLDAINDLYAKSNRLRGKTINSKWVERNLKVGQKLVGTISSVAKFGPFVEIGPGVKGLVHISETWYRIDDASDIFSVGDPISVVIKSIEPGRISLSAKFEENDPYNDFIIGKVITGVVKQTSDFGVFVEIMPGIDGLVHKSEISGTRYITNVADEVNIGDEVEVKIIQIDKQKRHIGLSMKKVDETNSRISLNSDTSICTIKGPIKEKEIGAEEKTENIYQPIINVPDSDYPKKERHPSRVIFAIGLILLVCFFAFPGIRSKIISLFPWINFNHEYKEQIYETPTAIEKPSLTATVVMDNITDDTYPEEIPGKMPVVDIFFDEFNYATCYPINTEIDLLKNRNDNVQIDNNIISLTSGGDLKVGEIINASEGLLLEIKKLPSSAFSTVLENQEAPDSYKHKKFGLYISHDATIIFEQNQYLLTGKISPGELIIYDNETYWIWLGYSDTFEFITLLSSQERPDAYRFYKEQLFESWTDYDWKGHVSVNIGEIQILQICTFTFSGIN